jgi:acyl-coenzyme A thioesterase PaaI-like protein
MSTSKALQDLLPHGDPLRGCFGCGADNAHGLRIKSRLEGDEGVAVWQALDHHQSFSGFLNGGIAATLIDCHSAVTAIALYCVEKGFDLYGESVEFPAGWTKVMTIEYVRPTPLDEELTLRAKVIKKGTKSRTVACSIFADGKECVKGEVVVVIPEAG